MNEEKKPSEFIHRDDLDMDVMAEFEAAIKEQFGDQFQVVCAGDVLEEELPPELLASFQKQREEEEWKFFHGKCIDCDAVMPNFSEVEKDDWHPAEGWKWFTDHKDEDKIVAWQCPQCDAADQEG